MFSFYLIGAIYSFISIIILVDFNETEEEKEINSTTLGKAVTMFISFIAIAASWIGLLIILKDFFKDLEATIVIQELKKSI